MRDWKSVSPSQFHTFADCKRQWWFQSVLGLPTPQRASAALGEAVHSQLEAYADTGKLPDSTEAGRIAKAGLSLLPEPGTSWTEVSMSDRKKADSERETLTGIPQMYLSGIKVNGFIDLLNLAGPRPLVLDHKCLPASAVVHTDTGPLRVENLSTNWTCAAWTGEEVVAAPALAPVDGGVQEVYRVDLKNGMVGRYGYSHPILTRRGWVCTDGLLVGDEVAVALSLPDTYEVPVPDALIKVVAMLLCDGALKSDSLTYTKTGAARAEYVRLLAELGIPCTERGLGRDGRAPYVQVSASSESPLRQMLKAIGLDFVGSTLRRVPRPLMGMSRRQIGIFLGGVWAGDGAAYLVNAGGRKKPVITFATRSKGFCEDVRDLLLRSGLAVTLTEAFISYKGERRPYYAATVVGKASKVAFLERAIRGEIAIGDRCSGRKTRAGNTPPTLQEVLEVAEAAPNHAKGSFPIHVEGPIWWVPVVAVTSEGKEPCFDIEVPKHHTFVAEGVVTHNTTSDLKYAKTADELREDPQMVLYGTFALAAAEAQGVEADAVDTGHVVYLTKGAPLARKTVVTLDRKHLAAQRERLATVVEEMKGYAKERSPDAVPGEAASCNKYGGCHFRDKCAALGVLSSASTPFAERFRAEPTTPENTMSIDPLAALAAIKARKAAAESASAPLQSVVTPEPTSAPLLAPATATPTPDASQDAARAALLEKYGIKKNLTAPAQSGEVSSIVPPDAPPQTKPAAFKAEEKAPATEPAPATETPTTEKVVRKPKNYAEKLAALNWSEAQVSRMNAEAMRAAIDGALDGRKYSVLPHGDIYIPQEGLLDTATIPAKEEVAETVPVAAPAPVPVAAPVAAPTLVLYIDCFPEKGRDREYTMLEDIVRPLAEEAVAIHNRGAKEAERVDYYGLIPYNRGPTYIASMLLKAPPVGIVVCNSRYPATNACLEVLVPLADVVVRAVR